MKKFIKLFSIFAFLTFWLGGSVSGQVMYESFNNGPVNGSVYSYSSGSNCAEDSYWIGNSMNSGCTPFPNITKGGDNFMTVNSNYGSSIPGNGQIWSRYVGTWNGVVNISIKGVHRFKSYSGNWPPEPVSFDVKANGQTIYSFTIPLTQNWQTFNGFYLAIPTNTNYFSVVQTGGACWNCDYAIDDLLIYCVGNKVAGKSDNLDNNIEELDINDVKIFPNPASNVLNVDLNELDAVESISIFSSTGDIVLTQNVGTEKQLDFDISSLPVGTYFVQTTYKEGETSIKRFVKAE